MEKRQSGKEEACEKDEKEGAERTRETAFSVIDPEIYRENNV